MKVKFEVQDVNDTVEIETELEALHADATLAQKKAYREDKKKRLQCFISITINNIFHDNDFTSRIKEPRNNSRTRPIFFVKKIQYISSVI